MGARKKSRGKKEPWQAARPAPPIALPSVEPDSPVEPLIKKPPPDLDQLTDADIERVLKAIIFFDPRRCLDADGDGLPLSAIDDVTALGLAGFDVEEIWESSGVRGEPRINTGILKRFKQADRANAAKILWQKQGKFGSGDELRKKDRLSEVIAAMKEGPVERKEKK